MISQQCGQQKKLSILASYMLVKELQINQHIAANAFQENYFWPFILSVALNI